MVSPSFGCLLALQALLFLVPTASSVYFDERTNSIFPTSGNAQEHSSPTPAPSSGNNRGSKNGGSGDGGIKIYYQTGVS